MTARTPKKKTPAVPKADWAKAFIRAAAQLVEQLASRGLLDGDEVQRLTKSIEEAGAANPTTALGKIAALNRRLASELAQVDNLPGALKGKKLDALFESNRIIATSRDASDAFEKLLAHVKKLVPCDGATLYLVDRKTGRLNVAHSSGPAIDLIDRIEFDQGIGFSGWVAKTQRPVLFGSLKRSQPAHTGVIKSFVSVPLVVGGETIGVLNLGHADENVFTRDDLRLLTLLAAQAAGMIQKVLYEAELKNLEITDGLTGLYNRRHLTLRMQDEVNRASRFLQEFSVILLDLDDFSQYNEAFGTETGDRALAELSTLLSGHVRSSDILARYEGDRFAVILPSTNRTEALRLADRLKLAVQGHAFPRRKRLGMSAGVASYPGDATEPQELLNVADKALYESRRDGLNRIVAISAIAA